MANNKFIRLHSEDNKSLFNLQKIAKELGFSRFGTHTVKFTTLDGGKRDFILGKFNASAEKSGRAIVSSGSLNEIGIITACIDYLPKNFPDNWQEIQLLELAQFGGGTISITGRGRNYHDVLNEKLSLLSDKISEFLGMEGHLFFVTDAEDDAVRLAINSGMGWQGKNALLLNRDAGSTYFLCQIYVDFALPKSPVESSHCGSCRACMDICPTQAIVAEGVLDYQRCISYLTIEHDGPIPEDLRPLMGSRIYGCDDCQLVCPWNKFANKATVQDFDSSKWFEKPNLLDLWWWSENDFIMRTVDSPVKRIGFGRWKRNIAIAMGNTLAGRVRNGDSQFHEFEMAKLMVDALKKWLSKPVCSSRDYDLISPHVDWALRQFRSNPDWIDFEELI